MGGVNICGMLASQVTHFLLHVLFPAHKIRNCKTKVFLAASLVKAKHKVCIITGTPFVIKPRDIQSLFAFTEFYPLSDETIFESAITTPIEHRQRRGLA
jgi:hypothetical protein